MTSYVSGRARSSAPLWELLIDGRALVLGTELRESAYEIVKREWPRSLAMLELARVPTELDSDLGLTVHWITERESDLVLTWIVNFADATDDGFLERFAAYDGPKNHADVPPDFELVIPDAGLYEVRLAADCWL